MTGVGGLLTVIGGGIFGAMSAYLARRQGCYDHVTLVEANTLGSGVTSHSLHSGIPLAQPRSRARTLIRTSEQLFSTDTTLNGLSAWFPILYVVPVSYAAHQRRSTLGGARTATAASWDRARDYYGPLRLSSNETVLAGRRPGLRFDSFGFFEQVRATPGITVDERLAVDSVRRTADGRWRIDTAAGHHVVDHVLCCVGSAPPPFAEILLSTRSVLHDVKRVATGLLQLHQCHSAGDEDTRPAAVVRPLDRVSLLPTASAREYALNFRSECWPSEVDRTRWNWTSRDTDAAGSALQLIEQAPLLVPERGLVAEETYSVSGLPEVSIVSAGAVVVRAGSGVGVRTSPAVALEALSALAATTTRRNTT